MFGPVCCREERAVPVCGVAKAWRCVVLAQGADVPIDMFGRVDIAGVCVEVFVVGSVILVEAPRCALDG